MKITKILLTLALAGNILPAVAQDTYWPLDGNKKFNTSNNGVISITGNEIPIDYPVRAPRTIFTNNGAVLFNFGEYFSGMLFAGIGFSSNNARQAFAIPGQCNKYGVVDFGGVSAPHGNYLTYSIVDVTGVTNDINTTNIPSQSSLTYLHYAASAVYYSAIAGKLNSDGTRYLYYMNNEPGSWYNTMYRFTIDFNGNINTTPVTLNTGLPQGGGSMKISRDGNTIAYVNASSNVVVYDIVSNSYSTYTGVTIGSGLTGGLEQVTIGTQRRWYISTGSSMGYITEGGGYTQLSTSEGIHSDLALGVNGQMYYAQGDPATASGQLRRFNPGSAFFSPVSISGALIAGKNWNNTCYSFGNQVAGENTNSFSIGSIGTPTISVNGNTAGGIFDVLDCKPIILANASGTVGSYFQIRIYENVNQTSVLRDETGIIYGNFGSVDLRSLNSLSPVANNWLSNHPGWYTIIVSYSSPCGGTQYAYKDIRVNAGPAGSLGISGTYQTKANSAPTTPVVTHNFGLFTDTPLVTVPVNPWPVVGRSATIFNISSNTGVTAGTAVCTLEVHIDQAVGSAWSNDVIDPILYINNCAGLQPPPPMPISGFVDANQDPFFTSANATPGSIWRIRVGLTNDCGTLWRAMPFQFGAKPTASASGYIREAGAGELGKDDLAFAPVPFGNSVTATLSLAEDARVSMRILGVDGRVVSAPYQDKHMSAGSTQLSIETAGWPAGVYFYECTVNGRKLNGKIIKQ